MDRRIFGLENEYGVTCTLRGQRRLSPDEVARYLFRRVVSWGRSSNVFLENGARLYLDVGSHPEYATPECDTVGDLVVHDKAGERTLEGLVIEAEQRLRQEGIRGVVYLFKNNTDSAGNSLRLPRELPHEPRATTSATSPKCSSRSSSHARSTPAPARCLQTSRGAVFCLAQRAEHIWEGVSSATTRSRPIINTRDEPHADAEKYRRLHVIVGDSNMSEYTTFLKIGATSILLRMLEDPKVVLRDMTLENPIRAIREISHDITCTAQGEARQRPRGVRARHPVRVPQPGRALRQDPRPASRTRTQAMKMWKHCLEGIEKDPFSLDRECDWVIKHNLIEKYRAKHDMPLGPPPRRVARLAVPRRQPHPRRVLQTAERGRRRAHGQRRRHRASRRDTPPQTTRAKLRGDFIRKAKERRRDYTVDWVHLKVNDQAQRTVLCKDPFKSKDDRVDRLIASL